MKKMNKSPSRWASFSYAFQGLHTILRTEKNTWIYIPISFAVIVMGIIFHIQEFEWIAIVLCFGLVWAFEAANTALEALVDLSTTEIHPIAKVAKDCAAAAVLIAALTSAVIGIIIFLPHVLTLLGVR
jgi:diacylglycerol kinase (ATP)